MKFSFELDMSKEEDRAIIEQLMSEVGKVIKISEFIKSKPESSLKDLENELAEAKEQLEVAPTETPTYGMSESQTENKE